ncbi:putative nuclease HARBI1 [Odontomachus brunneus]|uniref:putative nuclease HARBI1 n=1 Tax=Odontomachus brunneus TaxID=486640 RepID=UPI0013F2A19C|nr:putative nuclease HARBI1 [Odontomachus brunneus]XP_032688008.1 putative nuclease HARBI1 [Odontomachus brunneus]
MAHYIALLDSSDEDEFFDIAPPLIRPIDMDEDNENQNVLQMLHPVLGIIQRIEHVRIRNYIEHIVHNYNNVDFIMHFRLSRQVAYSLMEQFAVSDIFISIDNPRGHPKITAEKHILCYLWFVGHESASYRDVADRFGVTISSLYQIISRVTAFILSLAPRIIKYPSLVEKQEIAAFYEEEKGFPGIIGAIDGTHIRINKPIEDPDSYINRKQYFSLHIQGTVNHKMKFMDVFIGYPGSVHDARVFRNSPIYNDLRELCGDTYYILGDSAYPCLKQLLVPYKDNGHMTRAQRLFNIKLSSCRVVVENTFGCLKQRFRQLYHFKLRDIIRMVQVIHACCVLHNMANIEELEMFEAPLDDEYPDNEAQNPHIEINDIPREPDNGIHIRDEICRILFT